MGPLITLLPTIYTNIISVLAHTPFDQRNLSGRVEEGTSFLLVYTSVTTIDTNITLQALSYGHDINADYSS